MSKKKEHLYQFTTLTSEELNKKLFETTCLLNESNAKLQKSKKQQQEMFLNISHDLRAPLTVIKNSIEALLLHEPKSSDELQESLTFINHKVDELTTMINHILLITALDSEKKTLHLESVNASHFLEDFFYQMESDSAFSNRKLCLKIPETLSCNIEIDTKLIFIVLKELFSNALRFSDNMDTITLQAYLENEQQLCIIVSDTGCGISQDSLVKIFERTYMMDEARTPNENTGNGLGLPLVKSILNRHHASIICESSLGKGSSFILHFPIFSINS